MIAQIFIFILGAPAMFLITRPESWSKYGYLLGLAGQPFWYYSSIQTESYGMLCLSILYTYSWAQGIYFKFYKNENL